jgi:hypothetical protein
MPGKLDILQAVGLAKFYAKMNFIAAGWIIAVHQHGGIGQFSKVPRTPRMIEDDFLVKLFQFCVQEKKREAASRISIIRSISSVVL